MPIPKNYSAAAEASIASYEWTDLADGTGTVHYWGFSDGISGGPEQYSLGTSSSIYSGEIEHFESGAGRTYNFDASVFNLPRVAKGTAYVRIQAAYEGTVARDVTYTVTLQKVDAASAVTNLATAQTRTLTGTGSLIFRNYLFVIPLTQTNFKKGDTLRLVLLVDSANFGEVVRVGFGCDPKVRSGTYITPASDYPTNLDVFFPYRVDL